MTASNAIALAADKLGLTEYVASPMLYLVAGQQSNRPAKRSHSEIASTSLATAEADRLQNKNAFGALEDMDMSEDEAEATAQATEPGKQQ
ncbi:hypothetical protein IWW36_003417 [Coemansia brasiliensis]|uniref:Uncharacterized protein n=1 Tax=Coemansia brasiliensis TaxID=2650707 RepID=A0A9W8LYK3_9FUNG|nr:hypothetical protein IWW36_003417 [Coemansia brasiliensis]